MCRLGYGVGRKMLIIGNKILVVRGEYVYGIIIVVINIRYFYYRIEVIYCRVSYFIVYIFLNNMCI